jgi:hypothetical protein
LQGILLCYVRINEMFCELDFSRLQLVPDEVAGVAIGHRKQLHRIALHDLGQFGVGIAAGDAGKLLR